MRYNKIMPRKTRGDTTIQMVEAARDLRKKPTSSEAELWEALRNRRLAGLKFRRQHPFHGFVLDYFCVKHQLALEIDGGIHKTKEQADHDRCRTEFLEMKGVRVLRFTNEEIENNLPGVLNRIIEATK